jgi:hypothetical protein
MGRVFGFSVWLAPGVANTAQCGWMKDQYVRCVRLAVKCGTRSLSNYILYNYTDTPQDFYERLRITVELNQELQVLIYSFPMKFIPLDAKDRSYVGKHWNSRLLRGVQCILLATMGKVGTHMDFFEAAFGRTADEFIEIAMMPDDYIIHRKRNQRKGTAQWLKAFRSLSVTERVEFTRLLCAGAPERQEFEQQFPSLAEHYPTRDQAGG